MVCAPDGVPDRARPTSASRRSALAGALAGPLAVAAPATARLAAGVRQAVHSLVDSPAAMFAPESVAAPGVPPVPKRRGGLATQIVAWSFVPTAIILATVALVTFYAYQQVTEDLAVERDQEVTRLAAGQITSVLSDFAGLLDTVGRTLDVDDASAVADQAALERARYRLAVFDAGVVLLDSRGTVRMTEPPQPALVGQDWSGEAFFAALVQNPGPVFSPAMYVGGEPVVLATVPVLGSDGTLRGALGGMFRLGAEAVNPLYGTLVRQRLGETGALFLVDHQGQVLYHSDPSQIGRNFAQLPAVQAVRDGQSGALRTRDVAGQAIVAGFAPVPGTSWSVVHEESWDALMRPRRGYGQFLLLMLALGLLVPAVVTAIGVRRITRPIQDLTAAASAVAAGDFSQRLTVHTDNELEDLAAQFNHMADQLAGSYAELERRVDLRTRQLATLNAIAAVTSRSLDLQVILPEALDKTLEVMGLEAGLALLLEPDEATLTVRSWRGMPDDLMRAVGRVPLATSSVSIALEQGGPIVLTIDDVMPGPVRSGMEATDLTRLISVPLTAQDRLLGALILLTGIERPLSPSERDTLASIGQQIGVGIANARLLQETERAATIEERQRLARELHDSVTQSLYSLTLLAEAGRRTAASSGEPRLSDTLDRLGTTAQQALREMRLLVYELRPLELETEGLVGAVRRRLDAVERRSGIEARLLVSGELDLPAATEAELYRIVQEVLNNTLKHARASQVTVRLAVGPAAVTVVVADNGEGFEVEAASSRGGLGLASIRERAARLGASLEITSAPGQGVRVRLDVPLRDLCAQATDEPDTSN